MTEQGRPATGDGLEFAALSLGAVILAAAVATWLGARMATLVAGGSVGGGIGEWLRVGGRLATGDSPSEAWGGTASGLPSPVVYWACTVVAVVLVGAVFGGLWWMYRRLSPSATRTRFGQPVQAREATIRDVAPLVVDSVKPPQGRMLLGRMHGNRALLATEDRVRHPLEGRAAKRQGNRGSVALIGPTGSGKTALATAAIATWDGPVVAVSVKRDLYDTTVTARAVNGDVAVFDPGGVTGLPTARWSPLVATTTSSGALRTGRALAQAIPKGGVTNAEYWAEHGEGLLGAFMCVAGLSRLLRDESGKPIKPIGMEQLAAWVRTLATATDPTIHGLITRALDNRENIEIQLLGRHAATTFTGVAREDEKIRSSVYSTAVLALKPWLEPAVAHSASASPYPFYSGGDLLSHEPRFVDLEWLMAGEGRNNTLYLSAPAAEFERLSPVLGGVLADLKDTVHAWDIANRHLDKPLLIVIDEAAHLQLGWLPTEVSTIAALGAFFVTCWQNLAQIDHRYDTLADAVLSGHRTKCFFAGIDDLTTARYLTTLLGHEDIARLSTSRDIPTLWTGNSAGRRSVSESTQRSEFAPAHTIREMVPGEAVLLHGTLPPIHLTAIRYWEEADLAKQIGVGTATTATCPLTDKVITKAEHQPVDIATLEAAKEQLPAVKPTSGAASGSGTSGRGGQKQSPGQMTLPGTTDTGTPGDDPIVCPLCHDTLEHGEYKEVRGAKGVEFRCAPSCRDRKEATDHARAATSTSTMPSSPETDTEPSRDDHPDDGECPTAAGSPAGELPLDAGTEGGE